MAPIDGRNRSSTRASCFFCRFSDFLCLFGRFFCFLGGLFGLFGHDRRLTHGFVRHLRRLSLRGAGTERKHHAK